MVKQQYVSFLIPEGIKLFGRSERSYGFQHQTNVLPVDDRDPRHLTVPVNSVGYRFFEQEITDNASAMTSAGNFSEWTYFGRILSPEEVGRNVTAFNYIRFCVVPTEGKCVGVVKTTMGSLRPLRLEDRVMS